MLSRNATRGSSRARRVLICGAGSAMARAFAQLRAQRRDRIVLAGRDAENLERLASDLRIRYEADVHSVAFDARNYLTEAPMVYQSVSMLSGLVDDLVFFQGMHAVSNPLGGDQEAARQLVEVNFASVVRISRLVLPHIAAPGGTICGLGASGDRAADACVFLGAKTALSSYLDGLRVEQQERRISVVQVTPGPTDTAWRWDQDSRRLLSPEAMAKIIDHAMERRKRHVRADRAKGLSVSPRRSTPPAQIDL